MSDRIRRAPRDKKNPYFMMHQKTAQDERLSFEARGLLAYLLSKPDDWQLIIADLMRAGGCGRDKVRKILAQLEEQKYLEKRQVKDEKGLFSHTEYWVYERPLTENPSTESPSTEKPLLQSTEKLQSTDKKRWSAGEPRTPTSPDAFRKEQVLKHPLWQAYAATYFAPPSFTQRNAKTHLEVIEALSEAGVKPEQLTAYMNKFDEGRKPAFVWLAERIPQIIAGRGGSKEQDELSRVMANMTIIGGKP